MVGPTECRFNMPAHSRRPGNMNFIGVLPPPRHYLGQTEHIGISGGMEFRYHWKLSSFLLRNACLLISICWHSAEPWERLKVWVSIRFRFPVRHVHAGCPTGSFPHREAMGAECHHYQLFSHGPIPHHIKTAQAERSCPAHYKHPKWLPSNRTGVLS